MVPYIVFDFKAQPLKAAINCTKNTARRFDDVRCFTYFLFDKEVLRIINNQAEAMQANSIPSTKLNKIMKANNIN